MPVMRVIFLTLTIVLLAAPADADDHYFSLKEIFPSGKCSPVIPNFEVMKVGFTDGEITQYKIYDSQGRIIEIITSFINKDGDQWALVGSKTESKVIFCLYASGIGRDSIDRRTISSE